jgi:4-hydroxybenzoate polyprenyltransferase
MPDVKLLWWLCLGALVGTQFIIWPPGPFSIVLIAYALLMYKYFFIPGPIGGNIFLALVTHNPSMLILQLCATGFLRGQPLAAPESAAGWKLPAASADYLACLLFYLPSLIWELSRKVRPPSKETSYQTYSSLLGCRTAAALAFAPGIGILTLVWLLGPRSGYSPVAIAFQAVILILFASCIIRFIFAPEGRGPSVRAAGQAYALSVYGIIFIDMAARALSIAVTAHA